ncbi:MAG: rhomboid family intramembrane serine protease [Pseudomonadota bacterium]
MTLIGRLSPIFTVIVAVWFIHAVNVTTGGVLYAFGIEPRTLRGLDGVLGAPWLHGDWQHLLSNTAGLAVLGGLICLHSRSTFWRVTLFVTVLAGIATWALARPGLHIGASLLVFGYFGYLIVRGWVERTPMAIVTALMVASLYGGMLYGVLPTRPGVSFEGHLFGAVAGFLAARWRLHLPVNRAT